MRAVAALLVGEVLVFTGLWLLWPPVALVALGGQLVVAGLVSESGGGS